MKRIFYILIIGVIIVSLLGIIKNKDLINEKLPLKLLVVHNYKGTEYKLWSVKEEYEQDIIETLNSTFSGEIDEQTLVNSIYVNALNMVEDNIEDYMSSIQNYKNGTGLENHTDDEIKSILIPTIWSSVAYMMITRSGINAKEKINIQEFSYIKKFNNNQIITILGTAISDIAEMGIREIAKTVVNLQKEEKNKNHTFVNKQEKEYSNNKEKEIGGIENGENRIHESEGLQHTKSSNDTGEITTREILNDEITLFKDPEESRVHNIIDGQQIEQSFGTSSRRVTNLVQKIVQNLAQQENTNEKLKATNQMEWVRRMNNYKLIAEEQATRELIYN